jgi:indole-3-glycerol phosphate synthase
MISTSNSLPSGVRAPGCILDRIVEAKMKRLEESKRRAPLGQMTKSTHKTVSFRDVLSRDGVNVIAEIKQRSPSKGVIREDFDPVRIAETYAAAGAAAVSVLTEEDFFGGSLEHLWNVRSRIELPLLRKDFIFDEYQLHESFSAGADAILLIVAILEDELLASLIRSALELGLDSLVEVHSAEEMKRAAQAGANIIGINNRDLTTFAVDLETSIRLAQSVPGDAILVSESGIENGSDIRSLRSVGFNAFLVGEHLMRAPDPGAALRSLIADAGVQ